MRKAVCMMVFVFSVVAVLPVTADTIVYRGREYTGVIIEELENQYAVEFPDTGRTRYFRKEDVTRVEFSDPGRQPARRAQPDDTDMLDRPRRVLEPENDTLAAQQEALREFKERTRIRSQAEFDAAFEHWAQLDEEERSALLEQMTHQASAAEAERRQVGQALTRQRQELARQQEDVRSTIEGAITERDRQLLDPWAVGVPLVEPDRFRDDPWDDPDAEYWDERQDMPDVIVDAPTLVYPGWAPGVAWPWGRRVREIAAPRWWAPDPLAQVQAEALWIDQAYAARIAEERRALRRLAEEERRFQHQSSAELRRYAQRVQRLAGTANYLAVLEEALTDGYEPTLEYRDLFSVSGRGVMQRHVHAVSPILRIDWWVDTANPLSDQLTVRVYDSESDQLIRTDTAARLPIEHFMIIDRPGEYLIEVDAPSALTYTLEAKELRDYEYVPISPRD